jgi:hypothetical protein
MPRPSRSVTSSPARDRVIDLLAGRHPDPGQQTLAREDPTLGKRERCQRVAALVLEQMAQILVARDAEEGTVTIEKAGC